MRSQPSKGDSGFSKLIAAAGITYLIAKYAPILFAVAPVATTATAPSQTAIPSREYKVIEFDDRGRTYRYFVDVKAGTVEYIDKNIPAPDPPPKPIPPTPEPPKLDGLALRVNEWFRAKVTTRPAETAAELYQAIETTLAVTGGLGLKGQQIIDELAKQIDAMGLRPALAGFPLGDVIKVAVGDDPEKIAPALRDAMKGLRAVK